MLRWFVDFFNNRTFNVRINNFYSDYHNLDQGVPQGAILSPLLFSLILSDLPNFQDTHSLLYADDLSMFVIEDSLDLAINKLQNSINSCNTWLKNNALKLNPLKSSIMMFTRKKVTFPPNLFLDNVKINLVTKFKFLGLFLDAPFLTWKHHINYLKASCTKKLSIMRALTSKSWGANRQ